MDMTTAGSAVIDLTVPIIGIIMNIAIMGAVRGISTVTREGAGAIINTGMESMGRAAPCRPFPF